MRVRDLGSNREIGQRAPVLDRFGFQEQDIDRLVNLSAEPFKVLGDDLIARRLGHLIAVGRIEVADMLYEVGLGERPVSDVTELAHWLKKSYLTGNSSIGIRHTKDEKDNDAYDLEIISKYVPPLYKESYMGEDSRNSQ